MGKKTLIKRKKRNKVVDVIAALILVAIILTVSVSLKGYIQYKFLDFATASQETVDTDVSAEIVVMRSEYVVTAPVAGNFVAEADEDERVKEGASIGYIEKSSDSLTPNKVAVDASIGGIVSYKLDGWEQILTPDQAENVDWQSALDQLRKGIDKKVDEETNNAKGRNVAKIIDNLVNYLVLLKTVGKEKAFAIDDYITFSLSDGTTLNGSVTIADSRKDGNYYYLSVSSAESSLLNLRYDKVTVITDKVSGIGIPSSAVFENKSGKTGVYCTQKRQLIFKEVTVKADNGDIAIVEGLSATDVVVTNPHSAHEGQRTY